MVEFQRVSHGVSQNEAQFGAAKKAARRRGAGPYLVQSGRSYLFQIKLPKEIGGGRGSRPVQISLGPIPRRRARILADRLASIARVEFQRLARVRDKNGANAEAPFDPERESHDAYLARIGEASFEPDLLFPGDHPIAQMTGALRMALRTLEADAEENTPLGHIAAINRQVHRKASGLEYDAVIVDNADLLRERYVEQGQKMALEDFRAEFGVSADVGTQNARREEALPVAPTEHSERNVGPDAASAAPVVLQMHAEQQTPNGPHAPTSQPPHGDEVLDPLWAELQPGDGRAITQSLPGGRVPSFLLDRRKISRPPSSKPLFSEVSDKHIEHLISKGSDRRYIGRVRMYRELFIDLIRDHPADTYTPSDMQAYIEFLRYWPAEEKDRQPQLSPREMIRANIDLTMKPLSLSTLQAMSVGSIKTALTRGATLYDYKSSLTNAKLTYPNSAPLPTTSAPLGASKTFSLLRAGCPKGFPLAGAPLCRTGLAASRYALHRPSRGSPRHRRNRTASV